MLPAALLSLESIGDGRHVPRYLRGRDEAWVSRALSEHADCVGLANARVDQAWADRIEPALRRAGAAPRAIAGVRHILGRAFGSEVCAALPPPRIREVVFAEAASGGPREEVLERASCRLGISTADLEAGLFADRLPERVVRAPRVAPTATHVREAYNLALVQGLLLRAVRVRVEVEELTRAVVRFAKLRGLLASFEASGEGACRIDLSGPLSLFRNTLKYGRALATFFPVLLGIPGYHLEAACSLREEYRRVVVQSGDPVPLRHALPRDADSAVERALVRDVRRLGGPWTIARETVAVRAGSRLFFPDFTLRAGDARLLVEVVGYYTREYLERKAAALRAAKIANLIVCVDASLDCGQIAFDGGAVIVFRRRVDAAELLRVADAMARRATRCDRSVSFSNAGGESAYVPPETTGVETRDASYPAGNHHVAHGSAK